MKSLKYIFFAFVISFIALSNTYAEICIYKNDNIELRCTLSQGTFASSTDYSVSCAFNGSNIKYAYVEYENNSISEVIEDNYRTFSRRMSLKGTEYMNTDGSVDCNNVSTVYMDFNTLSATTTPEVYDLKSTNSCEYNSDVYNYQSNLYHSSSSFRGCKAIPLTDTESGTPSNNGFPEQKPDNGSSSSGEIYNTSGFCSGTVLNVFTALGWAIMALKIIIPIVIIVFGSIDFGKAVIASKDDEIKKATKSLVMRAIAGIIIFFVPTIIKLAISLVGGEEVYNGTKFGACTECMLDPTSCNKGDD